MQHFTTQTRQQIEGALRARCSIGDPGKAWDAILPGLHALHSSSDLQDWDISGIREMLESWRALLVIDPDDPTGFAVVELRESPYAPSDLELFVHLAWHKGGNALARFQPAIEQIARTGGAKYMRFYSQRPGMHKAAPKVGYRARSVEYVKEI